MQRITPLPPKLDFFNIIRIEDATTVHVVGRYKTRGGAARAFVKAYDDGRHRLIDDRGRLLMACGTNGKPDLCFDIDIFADQWHTGDADAAAADGGSSSLPD